MSARFLQRIGCCHSVIDFAVTTHLDNVEVRLRPREYLLYFHLGPPFRGWDIHKIVKLGEFVVSL